MTQLFCDLCGKIAIQDGINSKFMAFENAGEKYLNYENMTKQCSIRALVTFTFHDHRTGFGGPPDLCESCARKLIAKLLAKGDQ